MTGGRRPGMRIWSRDREYRRLLCQQAFEIKAENPQLGQAKIAALLEDVAQSTVGIWLRDPRFYPFEDEVVLERALDGDRAAFDQLSYWDMDAFYAGLQRHRAVMTRTDWLSWLGDFAERTGLDARQLGYALRFRYRGRFRGPTGPGRKAPPIDYSTPQSRGQVAHRQQSMRGSGHRYT